MADSQKQTIDIFEVFRLGSSERATLEGMGLPVVQKRFTEITAITSIDQLKNATALATLPAPGKHYILASTYICRSCCS